MQTTLHPTVSWDSRYDGANSGQRFSVRNALYSGRTRYQDVSIVDTFEFGKMLLIDGCCQSAQLDEYIYHESLTHPALAAHWKPRDILVIGGGEGATLREILRHPSVERVVMVDIDAELVDLCERYLPEWHRGSFEDPRVELVLLDGKQFIAETSDQFDVIIVDVCDALEEGEQSIYSSDFYTLAQSRLSLGGLIVVQTQESTRKLNSDHVRVYRNLKQSFAHVDTFRAYMPSLSSVWSFLIANDVRSIAEITPVAIDQALIQRGISEQLRYYDGETHSHLFALTKDLREVLGATSET